MRNLDNIVSPHITRFNRWQATAYRLAGTGMFRVILCKDFDVLTGTIYSSR